MFKLYRHPVENYWLFIPIKDHISNSSMCVRVQKNVYQRADSIVLVCCLAHGFHLIPPLTSPHSSLFPSLLSYPHRYAVQSWNDMMEMIFCPSKIQDETFSIPQLHWYEGSQAEPTSMADYEYVSPLIREYSQRYIYIYIICKNMHSNIDTTCMHLWLYFIDKIILFDSPTPSQGTRR